MRHGGNAYAAHGSPSDIAGAFSAGSSIPVVGPVRATASVSGLMYDFEIEMPGTLRGNPGSLQRGFQTDMLLHLGATWTLR